MKFLVISLDFTYLGMHGLPCGNGKLKDLSKFDACFFGVAPKQADRMDPQQRILLETAYECIVDAGIVCQEPSIVLCCHIM